MTKDKEIGTIKNLLNSQFNKYARRFTREVAEEIEQAYEQTYKDFMEVWSKWRRTSTNSDGSIGKEKRVNGLQQKTDYSNFFLKASDAYWTIGNGGKIPVEENYSPDENNFKASVNIDPKNIKGEIYQNWGANRGEPAPKDKVFENMFLHGIMGYNRKIVKENWYLTKESQQKYYKMYHIKGNINKPNRQKILQNIYAANIIPPTAAKKPIKDMEQRVRKITTKKHLDEKWKEISAELDKDIERLINNRN